MTIRRSIEKWWIESLYDRQERLAEMGAPEIVLTGNMKAIRQAESGKLKIGTGSREAEEMLNDELDSWEELKGNGGKMYYRFNGKLNFFPKAKYGLYVAMAD